MIVHIKFSNTLPKPEFSASTKTEQSKLPDLNTNLLPLITFLHAQKPFYDGL